MIIKRSNKYGVRVYRAGRQVWIGTFAKRAEAKEAERLALGSPVATHDETCDSFAARWVADFPRARASTNRQNGYAVAGFGTEFKGVKMASVTRADAHAWSVKNRAKVSAVRAMFSDAMNVGVIGTNPFSNLRLPQSRGRKDLRVISECGLQNLADAALTVCGETGPKIRATILFAAYVGLRPAEMFMLRWQDLDFAKGMVHIKHSLGATGEVTAPKNGNARTVVLPPVAADALRDMPRRPGSPYVFVTPKGTHFTKTTHYYYWRQVRLAAGRPAMEFYELRHFCATRLLELGVSHADVAIQLGHTDGGALVMSTYGHPSEDLARARIAAAFRQRALRLRVVGDNDDDDADEAAALVPVG